MTTPREKLQSVRKVKKQAHPFPIEKVSRLFTHTDNSRLEAFIEEEGSGRLGEETVYYVVLRVYFKPTERRER